ncbi:MAG: hypothetical protein QOG45_549 [Chloroflexota bacterium]|nr:hypothetical protein [Chloroflexota bacterium]
MLIQDFTYVDAPIAAVRSRLLAGADEWVTAIAVRARDDGERLHRRIGPAGGVAAVPGGTTRVSVGPALERGDAVVVVPLTWQSEGQSSGFPVLWADLEVMPIGEHETQLSLMGRYEPPVGELGRRLDRRVVHRVVQASVRSFLLGVAAALEAGPGQAVAPDDVRPGYSQLSRLRLRAM